MSNIKDDTFYGFYKNEIPSDRICIIPDNVCFVSSIINDAQHWDIIGIDKLIVGKNVKLFYSDAFHNVSINEIYVTTENDNYSNYLSSLYKMLASDSTLSIDRKSQKIILINDSTHDELKYYDFIYDEDSIYTGMAILNKKGYDVITPSSVKVLLTSKMPTLSLSYNEYPVFYDREYYTFNSEIRHLPLFFKIKKDSDGFLFAQDIITKEYLPIIYYKNGYLQKSKAIREMSAGISIGSIKLASSKELSHLSEFDKRKNRFVKQTYIGLVHDVNSRVKYLRNIDFSAPIAVESIMKKRKSDIIEDVRTLLLRVSDINTDIYKQYFNKFKEILNLENTTEIESKLINLSAELQLYLSCNIITFSENSNLIDNVNNLTSKYYDRLVSNEGSEEDMIYQPESIDVLANLIIKNINNMSYLDVDNISKCIAFMYFAEIKLARENDGKVDFKSNPYLEYFKKYIYYIIKTMLLNGYISLDININLEETNLLRLIEDIDISNLKDKSKKKVLTFDLN